MIYCRMFFVILIISFVSIGYSNDTPRVIRQGMWMNQEIRYIDGEVIIGVQEDTPDEFFEAIKKEYGEIEFLAKPICGVKWLKITSKSEDIFSVIHELNKNEFVEYTEPNIVGKLHHDIYYPNDPYYRDGTQWALNNIGQEPPGGTVDADIDAEEAWDIEKGDTNTIMVILDTGIPLTLEGDLCHPEFSDPDRIILGPDFSGEGSLRDHVGHGTHVAGIAGAEIDNSEGIAGVCGRSKLLILKINYEADGWSVAQAIVWTVDYANEHPDKRIVMNLSGGWGSPINLIEYAVWYLDQHDIVFVSTVGNWHSSFPGLYAFNGFIPRLNHPYGYPNVIAVGASDPWDDKAYYSMGYGTVLAPGGSGNGPDEEDIFSTLPNYYCPELPEDYGYMAGTSMAAPHVTGVAGLMLSANPSLSDSLVRHIIAITADDQGDREPFAYPPSKCGRINAYKSVLASICYPVFVGFKDYEIEANEYLKFEVRAYDINNIETELDYSVIGDLPDGAEFSRQWPIINKDPQGAPPDGGGTPNIPHYTFRWTPTMAQIGTHSILFRVEDTEGSDYLDTIKIAVKPPDNGGFSPVSMTSNNEPITLEVFQNITNTRIEFSLKVKKHTSITLRIYDSTGREVRTIIQNELAPGIYSFNWDGRDSRGRKVSNGAYFIRIESIDFEATEKVLLLR